MSPAETLNFVINQFIDDQTLAVVKLRKHRSSFDDDRLRDKNAEQNENGNNQNNIAQKFEAFRPDTLSRFAFAFAELQYRGRLLPK